MVEILKIRLWRNTNICRIFWKKKNHIFFNFTRNFENRFVGFFENYYHHFLKYWSKYWKYVFKETPISIGIFENNYHFFFFLKIWSKFWKYVFEKTPMSTGLFFNTDFFKFWLKFWKKVFEETPNICRPKTKIMIQIFWNLEKKVSEETRFLSDFFLKIMIIFFFKFWSKFWKWVFEETPISIGPFENYTQHLEKIQIR